MLTKRRPGGRISHIIPAGMAPNDAIALHLFALCQKRNLDLASSGACLAAMKRDEWPGVDVLDHLAEARILARAWKTQVFYASLRATARPAPSISLAPVAWIDRADQSLAAFDRDASVSAG